MANPVFYIYVLFRETGEPFYVGKGKGDRWLHHEQETRRYTSHKHAIIRKMRAAGYEIPKVKLHEDLQDEVACAYEKILIAAIGRADLKQGPLVNKTDGGDGVSGWVPTPEQRAKMISNRPKKLPPRTAKARANYAEAARNRSPEARANIAEALRNSRTPEWRAKISASRKGKKLPPEVAAKSAESRRGLKKSAETNAKISASNKGKHFGPLSTQHKANLSKALKGMKRPPFSAEHRAKIGAARRMSSGKARFDDARQHCIPGIQVLREHVIRDGQDNEI